MRQSVNEVKQQKQLLILNKLLIIFLLFLTSALSAQKIYDHDLNEERLSELKQNIRHLSKKPKQWTFDTEQDYRDALEKYRSKSKKSENREFDRESAYQSKKINPENLKTDDTSHLDFPKFNLGPLGQVILYVILGLALIALLYLLFISSNFNKNGAKYVPLDIDESAPADIPVSELERLLEEALKAQNYRKAIRVYYLFILKGLSEKQWISWEKQKTNRHYIQEMQNKKEAENFSNTVQYYEVIWYGKRNISKVQFQNIQSSFVTLLNALNVK